MHLENLHAHLSFYAEVYDGGTSVIFHQQSRRHRRTTAKQSREWANLGRGTSLQRNDHPANAVV